MHTTPKAMEIENETLKNIVDSFFNENSKFLLKKLGEPK